MYRILLATFACTLLAACTTTVVPYVRMSEGELARYNTTVVDVEDMVYCFEGVRTGSHIRKKRCATIGELMYALENNASYLDTLNYGSCCSAFSRGLE